MNSTTRNIIIAVVVIGAGFVLYSTFIKKDPAPALVSSMTGGIGNEQVAVGSDASSRDFLSILLNLKTLKLSGDIFTNAAFKNLQDFSKELNKAEPEGRPNPFAPIGTDVGVVGTLPETQASTPTETTTTTTTTPVANTETPAVQSVTTNPVTLIKGTTATLAGSTTLTGGTKAFEFGKTTPPTLLVTSGIVSGQNGAFTLPITALTKNSTYYVRAVVTVNGVATKGDIVTFTTLAN